MNGIHEVMGSIPISSTNSSNNLAARHPRCRRAVSTLCLFLTNRTPAAASKARPESDALFAAGRTLVSLVRNHEVAGSIPARSTT